MDVHRIAKREEELLTVIKGIIGSIEEKNEALESAGVFKAYNDIHFEYAELAQENSEALKRAMFLQWYAQVEPPFVSGLAELVTGAEQKVLEILDEKILHNSLDLELVATLSYYADWEFVFEGCSKYRNLVSFLENKFSFAACMGVLKPIDFNGRGQMGEYWRSVLEWSK